MSSSTGHDTPSTTANPDTNGDTARDSPAEVTKELRFEVLRSAFYHDRRETFFRISSKVFSFATIMLGSGAVAAFANQHAIVGQAIGFTVAAIGAAQLVWDPNSQARDHRDLRKRFYLLLSEIDAGKDISTIHAEMARIYADEPPIRTRTNRAAHNQAACLIWGDGNFEKA